MYLTRHSYDILETTTEWPHHSKIPALAGLRKSYIWQMDSGETFSMIRTVNLYKIYLPSCDNS